MSGSLADSPGDSGTLLLVFDLDFVYDRRSNEGGLPFPAWLWCGESIRLFGIIIGRHSWLKHECPEARSETTPSGHGLFLEDHDQL